MHDCDVLTHISVCFIVTVSKSFLIGAADFKYLWQPEGRLKNTVIPVQPEFKCLEPFFWLFLDRDKTDDKGA